MLYATSSIGGPVPLARRTISRTSLTQKCYELIKGDILSRKLKWGEKLNIEQLAQEFGVSRSPVVQAINRLAHEGLAVIIPQKGSFVVRPSAQDIVEVTQVRAALETYALGLAAPALTPKDFNHLDSVLASAENSDLAVNPQIFLESDRVFHDTLIQATGNARLMAMVGEIRLQVELFRLGTFSVDNAKESMDMHRRIFHALQKNEVEHAKALMQEHIERVGQISISMFQVGEGNGKGEEETVETPDSRALLF